MVVGSIIRISHLGSACHDVVCVVHAGKPAAADLQLGLATAPVLFAARTFPQLELLIGKAAALFTSLIRLQMKYNSVRYFIYSNLFLKIAIFSFSSHRLIV
jgi:hypothetical protein